MSAIGDLCLAGPLPHLTTYDLGCGMLFGPAVLSRTLSLTEQCSPEAFVGALRTRFAVIFGISPVSGHAAVLLTGRFVLGLCCGGALFDQLVKKLTFLTSK